MSEFDRKLHKKIIEDFLTFLNSKTSEYILKGGTSLMLCYGLDRFSEDIDLDCCHQEKFFDYVSEFCKINDYTYVNKKDTETVQRAVIHYKDNNLNEVIKPLKIEVSYRNKVIDSNTITKINNYSVYTLDRIATMKTQAYLQRDKIRDMYDICFIVNNKNDEISQNTKNIIQDAFGQKGLEQYDYVCQQEDVLIDKNKLAEDVLNAFDKLDLVNNQNIYQKKTKNENFNNISNINEYEENFKKNLRAEYTPIANSEYKEAFKQINDDLGLSRPELSEEEKNQLRTQRDELAKVKLEEIKNYYYNVVDKETEMYHEVNADNVIYFDQRDEAIFEQVKAFYDSQPQSKIDKILENINSLPKGLNPEGKLDILRNNGIKHSNEMEPEERKAAFEKEEVITPKFGGNDI